jgi:hypothetical protein
MLFLTPRPDDTSGTLLIALTIIHQPTRRFWCPARLSSPSLPSICQHEFHTEGKASAHGAREEEQPHRVGAEAPPGHPRRLRSVGEHYAGHDGPGPQREPGVAIDSGFYEEAAGRVQCHDGGGATAEHRHPRSQHRRRRPVAAACSAWAQRTDWSEPWPLDILPDADEGRWPPEGSLATPGAHWLQAGQCSPPAFWQAGPTPSLRSGHGWGRDGQSPPSLWTLAA